MKVNGPVKVIEDKTDCIFILMLFEFYFKSTPRKCSMFNYFVVHFQTLTLTKAVLIVLKVAFHCLVFLQLLLQILLQIQEGSKTDHQKDLRE